MGLILVVGGLMGWVVRREQVRRDALATIGTQNGYVAFRDEQTPDGGWRGWLYRRTGLESWREVAMVTLNLGPPPPMPAGPFNTITVAVAVSDPSGPVGPPPPPRVDLFRAVGRLGAIGACSVSGGSTTPAELTALAEGSVGELVLIQPWEVAAEAVGALAGMKTLRSLQIHSPSVKLSADAVRAVGRLRTLAKVDLSGIAPLTTTDLAPLGQLRDLERLVLFSATTDDAFLDALGECRHLQTLILGDTQITDDRLRRLATRVPNLNHIQCDGSLLTDAGIEALGGLSQLESCNLFTNPDSPARLTDASLIALGRCRSLSALLLPNGRFTDTGLAALAGLPFDSLQFAGTVESCCEATLTQLVAGRTFEDLTLNGPAITDALVPILAGHFAPRNAVLSLNHARITDAAASDLLKVAVSSLNLADTALGDAGLAILANHPTLSNLYAVRTRITPAGAAAFRAARPTVQLACEHPALPGP